MIEIQTLTVSRASDPEALFATSPETQGCFCMWFIIPVTEYHAGGREANRRLFRTLVDESNEPVGLLAYRDGDVVGWCAAGPRARYARLLRTPNLRQRDTTEDGDAWFVPCFYVRRDARRTGVSQALLEAAVELAQSRGAMAIEGAPFADGTRPSRDQMVGHELMFASCWFDVRRRLSSTRVLMRRDL